MAGPSTEGEDWLIGRSVKSIEGPPRQFDGLDDESSSDESDADFKDSDDQENAMDNSDEDEKDIAEELRFLREDIDGDMDSHGHGEDFPDQGPTFSERLRSHFIRSSQRVRFYDTMEPTESSDNEFHGQDPESVSTSDSSEDELDDQVPNIEGHDRMQGQVSSSTDGVTVVASFENADVESHDSGSDSSSDISSATSSETSSEDDSDEEGRVRQLDLATNSKTNVNTLVAVNDSEDNSGTSDTSSVTTSSSDDSTSDSDSDSDSGVETQDTTVDLPEPTNSAQPSAPPGKGLIRTIKNNRRGKKRRRLNALKELGVLHASANFTDLEAHDRWRASTNEEVQMAGVPDTDDIEAKKAALLSELADQERDGPDEAAKDDVGDEVDETQLSGYVPFENGSPSLFRDSEKEGESQTRPESRRSRLDVASTRRLLFGSLGLRTPKTAEEEAKLRARFMPDSQRVKEVAGVISELGIDGTVHQSREDWRSKIELSAVECEVEGVTLASPPFPFEQRWDPEAEATMKEWRQSNNNGKKRQRIQEQYYDHTYDAPDQYPEENLDFAALQDENVDEPDDVDELPQPPEDLSTLPVLKLEDVRPGTVVVFQALEVTTGWTPEVSDFKTAKVKSIEDDRTINIILASRDIPKKQTAIDEHTGKRIYSKFDIPDEEDDEEDDRGFRQLAFDDMLNARLLTIAANPNRNSHESVQRISESLPEAQETVHAVGETPDVSLTALDVPPPHKGDSATSRNVAYMTTTTSLIVEQANTQNHFPQEGPTTTLEQSPKETPGRQLRDDIDQELPTSSIYYDFESPQFNGFSTSPPRDGNSTPRANNSLSQDGSTGFGEEDETVETGNEESRMLDSYPAAPVNRETMPLRFELIDQRGTSPQAMLEESGDIVPEDRPDPLEEHPNPDDGDTGTGAEHNLFELRSSIPATQTPPASALSSSPVKQRETKPFFTGLDGSLTSDDDLPSLEQIASQVRASQSSPPTKREQRRKKRPSSDATFQPSPGGEDGHGPRLRSQTRGPSQSSILIDLTQTSDRLSAAGSSDGDFADTETQKSRGTGWTRKNGLSMRTSQGGAGKRKSRRFS